ncbi:MAG: adenine phosphoribosyltransferase [bacterium]
MTSPSSTEGGPVRLEDYIRNIPDFPVPGIQFKDISPLLSDRRAFPEAIRRMADPFRDTGVITVAGIESRGFLFASAIALELDAGVVMLRKPGKLPYTTISQHYALEYGKDAVEAHEDAVTPGDRVLLVDDLIATGGTLQAGMELIRKLGADLVGVSLLIELTELEGMKVVGEVPCSVIMRL